MISVGDVVTIYEDPVTETKVEGEARILAVGDSEGIFEGRTLYRCTVIFVGYEEEGSFQRRVLT